MFDVSGTSFEGDIGTISASIQTMVFNNTKVSGDLADFANYEFYTQLIRAYFEGTNVYGDIANLSVFTYASVLDFNDTQIGGDIAGFVPDEVCMSLRIKNTQVYGSINDIPGINEGHDFGFFDFSGTQIHGDIGVFAQAHPNLETLNLDETNITGDFGALLNLGSLTQVSLSNLKIKLDTLLIPNADAASHTVAIPLLYNDTAVTAANISGGTGMQDGNSMVWQTPATPTGTFSYDFSQNYKPAMANEITVSGTVTQDYARFVDSILFIDANGNPLSSLPDITSLDKPYVVRVSAPFNTFFNNGTLLGRVVFNNKDLVDQKEFTYWEGSTVISIDPSVFKGLSNGGYSLAVYTSQGSTSLDVNINIPTPNPGPKPLPQTGDTSTTQFAFLGLTIAAGLFTSIWGIRCIRKKRTEI